MTEQPKKRYHGQHARSYNSVSLARSGSIGQCGNAVQVELLHQITAVGMAVCVEIHACAAISPEVWLSPSNELEDLPLIPARVFHRWIIFGDPLHETVDNRPEALGPA